MLQGKMFVEAYLWLWGWFFWPDRDLQANWQVKGLLDDRPGRGGWTELVKWGAVNILQVPEVDSDVGKSDVCKEGCN